MLAKYPPASFGSFLAKVLTHPALNILDKNVNAKREKDRSEILLLLLLFDEMLIINLLLLPVSKIIICGVDAFKFDAYLSSAELVEFAKNARAAHTPRDYAQLTRANVFTTESILDKLNQLN